MSSSSWSMEDIISGSEQQPKEVAQKQEAPKSTLQMLAAAKPKETPVTPLTGVSPVTPIREVRGVTPLTPEPIAPVKNFQKVSNSITKQAIPAGVFKSGKSKELYDVLYSLTRGAFTPSRTIRISKPKLQKMSGIGAPQTLSQGLMHLQLVGLVKIVSEAAGGKHEGHEYEVFLYEEITLVTPLTGVTPLTNLPHLLPLETNPGYPGLSVENTTASQDAKTSSLKTNTKNDDEAAAVFSELNEKLASAVKNLTGKNPSKKEAEKWGDLADLLILELEKAARKTGGVSSVPGFLIEVLRRQFFTARQLPAGKSSKEIKKDTVGRSETDDFYEVKPLDEQGREAALEKLREFVGGKFFPDFEKWYTAEDWKWIMEQLNH